MSNDTDILIIIDTIYNHFFITTMSKQKIDEIKARQAAIDAEFNNFYLIAETRALTQEEKQQEFKLRQEYDKNERKLKEILIDTQIRELYPNPVKTKNEQLREHLKGVRSGTHTREITLNPVSGSEGTSIVESGAINLTIHDLIPTLNEGMELPENLQMVTGVIGDELWPISVNDAELEEVGEVATLSEQDLAFANIKPISRRTGIAISVSNMAIDNAAFDLLGFIQRKFQLAVRKYLAMKLYSQAAFSGNKGPFSALASSGTITLDDDAYKNILKAIAAFADKGFYGDAVTLVMDAVTEAELKATPKAFGQGGFIIENGKCAGYNYRVSHYVNTTLDGSGKVVPTTDRFLGIGFWEWEAVQQHGEVRLTIDTTSKGVAKNNTTAIVLNTAWSFTELKPHSGSNGAELKAFGLYKIVPATE